MFPNVRLLIAAVVASVVALSCGFALFAAFRVNHEPLSRSRPAPRRCSSLPAIRRRSPRCRRRPIYSASVSPVNQTEPAGAPATAAPPQPDHEDSAPSATASTAATAPEPDAAEPDQPAPEQPTVAQASEPKQDEAAAAPNEPPPATSSGHRGRRAAAAEHRACAPRNKSSKSPHPDTPDTTATAASRLLPRRSPTPRQNVPPRRTIRPPTGTALPRRRNARVKLVWRFYPAANRPVSAVPSSRRQAALPPGHNARRQARATVQPASRPSGVGGPFVPPPNQ